MDFAKERIALACAFRWAARLDLHEGVANHFSLAVDQEGAKFLMNPRGRHFSRVTASGLLLLDAGDAGTMERPGAPDPTAWALHGGIHRNVRHARCVLHVHSRYATALACLDDPALPPIDQNAMRFQGRVTVDDRFDGMGLDDEAERVARMVQDKPILLMRHHGVMAIGPTVAQAFDDLYYFERACCTSCRPAGSCAWSPTAWRPRRSGSGGTIPAWAKTTSASCAPSSTTRTRPTAAETGHPRYGAESATPPSGPPRRKSANDRWLTPAKSAG